MASERKAITVPVRPWFADHRFAGRIVLAAVEAMQLLAVTAQEAHPHLRVSGMRDGSFAKLLEIPPAAAAIDALVELEHREDGDLLARLLTRTRGQVMSRLVVHCELTFAAFASADAGEENWPAEPCARANLVIPAARVYQELVPFGPAYRTLEDRLILQANAVWGSLLAPELDHSAQPLGSPFPLDGAMHAACVHGQRLVDFVPFPVGFAARRIVQPTRAGERYRAVALLRARAADELRYDLRIVDEQGQVRETVRGLRMRDVSRGRIEPPAWIRAMGREGRTEAEA